MSATSRMPFIGIDGWMGELPMRSTRNACWPLRLCRMPPLVDVGHCMTKPRGVGYIPGRFLRVSIQDICLLMFLSHGSVYKLSDIRSRSSRQTSESSERKILTASNGPWRRAGVLIIYVVLILGLLYPPGQWLGQSDPVFTVDEHHPAIDICALTKKESRHVLLTAIRLAKAGQDTAEEFPEGLRLPGWF